MTRRVLFIITHTGTSKGSIMNIKHTVVALGLAGILGLAGCTAVADTTSTDSSSSSTSDTSTTDSTTDSSTNTDRGPGSNGGGPGGVDVSSVSTEEQLVELIQEAYGDASLDLHRGHQPVQDVLDEVLGISHDELHVRMEAGQNLSEVAEDLGVGTDALVAALVESWSPAVDNLLEAGTITQSEADAYLAALEEAFTFRVTWDGSAETPTFSGLDA